MRRLSPRPHDAPGRVPHSPHPLVASPRPLVSSPHPLVSSLFLPSSSAADDADRER